MRVKLLFLIPIFLIIVSIFTSVVAYQKTNELNDGYIYVDDSEFEVLIDGEYFLLIGNLGLVSDTVILQNETGHVLITIFDESDNIIKEYRMFITEDGVNHDSALINSIDDDNEIDVDFITDHMLTIELEEGKMYTISLVQTENHDDSEQIDIVFVNLPEEVVNMKNIMESVSFTTGVFAVISLLTILAILYVRRP